MWADYSATTECGVADRRRNLRNAPAGNADMPTPGQHEDRCVEPTPQSIPAWAPACLAALQGGQARRTARTSKPKYRTRTLTAKKQRFLTAVDTWRGYRRLDLLVPENLSGAGHLKNRGRSVQLSVEMVPIRDCFRTAVAQDK